ncbi:5-carboxymethyl-2-hydroxymuconate Delta-isomerase [Agaribacter flavus]|uniref:5-carboxymethyl-2-hydroxymuconate Delta-isomerase n=1 Tax=Agaribacter flavus TaxID=1902781 RepID=A0ABV7FVJ7_9ALTE
MPHFILHCSTDILEIHSIDTINQAVSMMAGDSGLFEIADIKVRVDSYDKYLVGHEKVPFIHVFSHIMQGRTVSQRQNLSQTIVRGLATMFPKVSNIAMNIYEFEKSTYCNTKMLEHEVF